MFRHRHILKNAARTALAALAASLLFSLGTAHADNRFGDGVGGAMGGSGSFGEGSVTIHHNLLPEEREEIDTDIADLRDELRALLAQQLAQQKAEFDAKLEEQKQQGVRVGTTTCTRGGRARPVGYSESSMYTCPGTGGYTINVGGSCVWRLSNTPTAPVFNAVWASSGGSCSNHGGGGG